MPSLRRPAADAPGDRHPGRVGERFFRTDMSGNIPGTGLGVRIDGEAGHDTRVSFFLPEPAQRTCQPVNPC